ncbi:MAG: CBS domain-containing protein [Caldilineaceae bacterium]
MCSMRAVNEVMAAQHKHGAYGQRRCPNSPTSAPRRHGLLVLNHEGKLWWGIVTVTDLTQPSAAAPAPRSASCGALVVLTLTKQRARRWRAGIRGYGRLPVVDRSNLAERLLGIIRRTDIIRAYNIALARRLLNCNTERNA